jgi:MFS family permease
MNPDPTPRRQRFAAVLRDRDFRRFYAGYATSNLGSAMAPVAIAFAVLDTGHGATGFGLVMGARILPVVLLLLFGGVFADRLGGRRVMIAADLLRTVAQGLFALLFLLGEPSLWAMCALAVLMGVGEGVFSPSLQALIPRVIGAERLADGNLLLNSTRSAAGITGPLLGGLVAALAGPAAVLAADAASYLVSVGVLLRLSHIRQQPAPQTSMISDLRAGWAEFRSRTWLWTTSLQFGLFNALVWAPFLVLGPLAAKQHLGGAGAWGLILACEDAGVVLAGLAMMGREPRRPLFWATLLTAGYALPGAVLAGRLPLAAVCAAVFACGLLTSAVLTSTLVQRHVPAEALGRVTAYQYFGAFALGPLGLVAAGPLASALGLGRFLAFGAVFQVVSVAAVLAVPAVRRLPARPAPDAQPVPVPVPVPAPAPASATEEYSQLVP